MTMEKGKCYCPSCGIKFEGFYNTMARVDLEGFHCADCDNCRAEAKNKRATARKYNRY